MAFPVHLIKGRVNLSILSGLTESVMESFFNLLGVNNYLKGKDWVLR